MSVKPAHETEWDVDLIGEIAAIRAHALAGRGDVATLVAALAHPQPALREAARDALAALLPMASLTERPQLGDGDERPGPQIDEEARATLPGWLLGSCEDWGPEGLFARAALREVQARQGQERSWLIGHLAELPGAVRMLLDVFATVDAGLATELRAAAEECRQRRYPLQVNVAPTLACQLDCPYCVSAGLGAEGSLEAQGSWEELLAILDWARAAGVRRVGLAGGEPTLYTRLPELLAVLAERGMEYYVATNGLMSTRAREALRAYPPLTVSLHLTSQVRNDARWEVFCRTAEELVAARIGVSLRVNIVSPQDDVEELVGLASRFGVREIRAAVPVPNANQKNRYIAVGELMTFGALIDRLVSAARRSGVPVTLCKPFPLCALAERTARTLLAGGSLAANCPVHERDYTNNMVVWPDGSFSPCLGVNRVVSRKVTEFADLAEAAREYRSLIDGLLRRPLLSRCTACPLWSGARCLGGCLSYRLGPSEGE